MSSSLLMKFCLHDIITRPSNFVLHNTTGQFIQLFQLILESRPPTFTMRPEQVNIVDHWNPAVGPQVSIMLHITTFVNYI